MIEAKAKETNGSIDQSALERELEALDMDIGGPVAVMPEFILVRIAALVREWNALDEQRAQLRVRVDIAKQVDDKDQAKAILKDEMPRVLKRMNATLTFFVDAMADEGAEAARNQVSNWRQIRPNMRTIAARALKERGIDVTAVLERTKAVEDEEFRRAALIEG